VFTRIEFVRLFFGRSAARKIIANRFFNLMTANGIAPTITKKG
jgi:hypothetical protein